jgi:undecaprenyl-diphosphatase
MVAIAIFYRTRIAELVVGIFRADADAWRYVMKLAVATLPAIVVGLGAKDFIEAQFSSPAVVAVCLIITGFILWTTRKSLPAATQEEPSWGAVVGIGLVQAFAILPGISRSGSTVAAALFLGVRSEKAAEFSFLLGIIAISGAAVLMLPDLGEASTAAIVNLALGSVAALISGLGAIWLFVILLRSQVFYRFSYYTWAVGALVLAWLALAPA